MRVLIVGSGGREHALAWKIAQSRQVRKLYCAPGNTGTARLAESVPIAADDVKALCTFAQDHQITLTVVGPEASLAAGIVDQFRKHKLRIFGPQKAAARIETSKAFSKDLMRRLRIPTAEAETFTVVTAALEYVQRHEPPMVIKADGLAQGKGVVVAGSRSEAREAVTEMLVGKRFGDAGARVLIEEFLGGEEMTVMAFTDGRTVIPLIPAQDHKRLKDGDMGPNTGGMGAYAPTPLATPQLMDDVRRTILEPAVEGLSQLGSPFQGVLYAGIMMAGGTPKVLEFNARMGDPEAQVVLPLLKTDVVDLMMGVVEHRLDQCTVHWDPRVAVCVVLAAEGYPAAPVTNTAISGLVEMEEHPAEDVLVFHAGTGRRLAGSSDIVTAGGRVLGVTGLGDDMTAARSRAYAGVQQIRFAGMQYRSDIGARAIA